MIYTHVLNRGALFERGIMGIETKQTVRFIILTALIVVGVSCSAFTKGKGNAEAAVAQFHDQYNAGHFREIYSQTDEEFKKSTTEADFVALLEALRRKLGTVKQASPAGWKVNSTPMGTMVSLMTAPPGWQLRARPR